MRLRFDKSGRRFFFLTFCVRGRKEVAHGLPQRFDPTVEDSRFLADGRQLMLSSFSVDVPVFPVNYDNCHLMNARNEALCRRAMGEEEECVQDAQTCAQAVRRLRAGV